MSIMDGIHRLPFPRWFARREPNDGREGSGGVRLYGADRQGADGQRPDGPLALAKTKGLLVTSVVSFL